MKKIIALLMAGMMTATAFAGCGGSGEKKESATEAATSAAATADSATADSAGEDWTYLENKGKMIIGITYFEPMNYLDENGELTGFETEFAKAVCEELKLEPVFQEIDWDSKEIELKSKSIDCIWNGMTITPERQENMSISTPYMENKQVMVCSASKAEEFAESVDGANIVAEAGSAGEEVVQSDTFFANASYQSVESQSTALLEVKAGTADIAVIDYVMSKGTITEDSDFSELTVIESKSFSPEQYGIALRKGSDATLKKLNDAIKSLSDKGKLKEIADNYNLADLLIVQ